MIAQPANHDTLPTIVYSLAPVLGADKCATCAFFPSDHYFSDEGKFMGGVELAFLAAEAQAGHVIPLGAPSRYAATDYGWIEAAAGSPDHSPTSVMRMKRPWEKPARHVAEDLLESGCVWNTFVMAGPRLSFSESASIRPLFANHSPSAITRLFGANRMAKTRSERTSR